MPPRQLPHLVLNQAPDLRLFTSTSQGGSHRPIPERPNPRQHGEYLQRRLREAWLTAENEWAAFHTERTGVYIEFKGSPGFDLVTQSLEDMGSKKVRLLNVRFEAEPVQGSQQDEQKTEPVMYATVYVAKDEITKFTKKLADYSEKTRPSGKPYHADLVNSIADLRQALAVESFWTDDKSLIPADAPEWCEVWLRGDGRDVVGRFENLLTQQQIEFKAGAVRFPERTVKVILVNNSQLQTLTRLSDDIAEYRLAKNTATFWTELKNRDQVGWVEDLLERIEVDLTVPVSICILDTGINNGHPLLVRLLDTNDCHSVDPVWGSHDHDHHGTLMAGVAGFGDLTRYLESNGPIPLSHRLESVKILPPSGQNNPELWGYITAQGIARAEIQAPNRKRVICMAVTAEDTRDHGRPSSWSAELDQLASGAGDETRRLLIVSAGNASGYLTKGHYAKTQITDSVHDPAQAWNALTVGAYTALDTLTSPTFAGYQPIAPRDGLSPFSTTSSIWDEKWPIKPEIVMEGGNLAQDGKGFISECDDLSLLSTYYKPQESHFWSFNMTSAATAQAAWFAARLQASYPDFWPETVRALMVHSASWPDTLRQQFSGNGTKLEIKQLLRIAGYGVPNLEHALYSATNSLTLIAQKELQPFDRKEDGEYRTKDMHLYDLPWPIDVLLNLPDTAEVEMRITLSYFIEPSPGEIGWRDRYRYASHGLRFDINSPGESRQDFVRRINAAERTDRKEHPGTESASEHWRFGSHARDKGSIHSDVWQGSAAELAASNLIAVFPRVGWWRARPHLQKWNRVTRYSLVVSISTSEETIDLYTPVAVKLGVAVPVAVSVARDV